MSAQILMLTHVVHFCWQNQTYTNHFIQLLSHTYTSAHAQNTFLSQLEKPFLVYGCTTFPYHLVAENASSGRGRVCVDIAIKCGLTSAELEALTADDYSLNYFKSVLINEHNRTVKFFGDDTLLGKVCAVRSACMEHSRINSAAPYSDFDQLPDSLVRDVKERADWETGYLKENCAVALAPEELWILVQEIFKKFENYELSGQRPPRKLPDKPISPGLKPFTKLFKELSAQGVKDVLQKVLAGELQVKQIDVYTKEYLLRMYVVQHAARYLSWDFAKLEWKWKNELSLEAICDKFPNSHLSRNRGKVINMLVEEVKLLPDQARKSLKKGPPKLKPNRPASQKIREGWDSLPQLMRQFVTQTEAEFNMVPGQEAAGDDPELQSTSLKIPYPRGSSDVVANFTVHDLRNSFFVEEYTAAHLQLPGTMSSFDIGGVVNNVIEGGCSSRLVVKIWCNESQEAAVQKAMAKHKHFKSAQRHYWWISQSPAAGKKSEADDDVKVAYVGFFSDEERPEFVSSSGLHRSSVVYAPLVPKLSKEPHALITCPDEMNVAVPLDFFKQHSYPAEWVADLMCGSGSAAVAAVTSGRNCLVADIDPFMVHFPCSSCLHCNFTKHILFFMSF